MIQQIKDRLLGKTSRDHKRSPRWRVVRNTHLEAHPTCAVCGGVKKLEVHHIVPFHIDPSRELDPSNLITLCESGKRGIVCHLLVGHRGNYRLENPFCSSDAALWNSRLSGKIEAFKP